MSGNTLETPSSESGNPPRWRLRTRRKIVFGLVTTCAFLWVAEIAARVVYKDRWPYHLLYDPNLVWRHRPGWKGWVRAGAWAEFNALGMREGRETHPKRTTEQRVLVMGDSIAFGYSLQYDETITHQAELRLLGSGLKVEILNAGVAGYGTEQETALLGELVPPVAPDLVLLFFCMGNDCSVESTANRNKRLGAFGGHQQLAVKSESLRFLFDNFALAYAVGRKVRRMRALERKKLAEAEQAGLRFSTLADLRKLPAEEQDEEFNTLRLRLSKFREVARGSGARCALVIFPDAYLLGLDPAEADRVVGRVVAMGQELGYPTLNLLPCYRNYPTDAPPLLRPKDGVHPSAAGAAAISEVLVAWLRRERLLERGPR